MYQTWLISNGKGFERFQNGEVKELNNGIKYIVLITN